ncbi:hypothetical protein [Blastomonas sp. AAP25]|uniref:hypothetical protein n=1 Tax=Blastomonas sp. AAP25 TaxID=1523416 RepID=UPI0006B95503|nr:hypothetical protein [Blastomonas sp. AAP25]
MTTTAKPKPRQRAKRAKSNPPEAGKAYVIELVDGSTKEQVNAALATSMPGWDTLVPSEQAELAQLILDQRNGRQSAKVKLVTRPDGGMNIEIDGPCEAQGLLRMYRTFGTNTIEPVNARATELLKYLESIGAAKDGRYNAALSFIDSMEPRNQMEALLLVEMYCTHDAAIRALSMLGNADWVPQMQTFGNLATKLLRASQGQMDTLARMRRGGQQTIRHVHVDNRGGQAVIADTIQTGGQNAKSDDQSHATGSAGLGTALLGADPFGNGVSISGHDGAEAMLAATTSEGGQCARRQIARG